MAEKKKEKCPYCGKLFVNLSLHKKCPIKKVCVGLKKLNLSGFVPDRRHKRVTSIKEIILREQLFNVIFNDPKISHLISPKVDISIDKLINLEELSIDYRPDITEINGLENLTKLRELTLCQNQIKEIKGLENLTNLQHLNLWHNQIIKIKGLETLINLQYFHLEDNKITQIKGLETLTNLLVFKLKNNRIKEIKGLEKLTQLQTLTLGHNLITEIQGLGALTNLQALYLGNNEINEIQGLDALTNLQALYLGYNQITEIQGLVELSNLQKLDLSYNFYVTEVKGFENLDNLIELKLDGTNIPASLLDQLGGLDKSGKANNPKRFVEYCKRKKKKDLEEKKRKKPKEIEKKELSEEEKEEKREKIKGMDTKDLEKYLLQQLKALDVISPLGHFEDKGPSTDDIIIECIGSWVWIKACLEYKGATWNQTTDRASGDPYKAIIQRDWIGLLESAPTKVYRPKELYEWSLIKMAYLCEYTDVGVWGQHKGSYVDELREDGTVTIRVAGEDFHDESPSSKTTVQHVQLKKIKKKS